MPPKRNKLQELRNQKKKSAFAQATGNAIDSVTDYVSDHYGKQASAALAASLTNLSISWRNSEYRDAILAPAHTLDSANQDLAVIRTFLLDLFGAFLTWYVFITLAGYLLRPIVKSSADAVIRRQGPPPEDPAAASTLHQLTWYVCNQDKFKAASPAASTADRIPEAAELEEVVDAEKGNPAPAEQERDKVNYSMV